MGWQELAAIIVVFAPLLGAILGGFVNLFTPLNHEFSSLVQVENDHHGHTPIPSNRVRLDKIAMTVTTVLVVTATLCATLLF